MLFTQFAGSYNFELYACHQTVCIWLNWIQGAHIFFNIDMHTYTRTYTPLFIYLFIQFILILDFATDFLLWCEKKNIAIYERICWQETANIIFLFVGKFNVTFMPRFIFMYFSLTLSFSRSLFWIATMSIMISFSLFILQIHLCILSAMCACVCSSIFLQILFSKMKKKIYEEMCRVLKAIKKTLHTI